MPTEAVTTQGMVQAFNETTRIRKSEDTSEFDKQNAKLKQTTVLSLTPPKQEAAPAQHQSPRRHRVEDQPDDQPKTPPKNKAKGVNAHA